jgi:prepilin-type N-terminal cleavage/methylation domain-containing protein
MNAPQKIASRTPRRRARRAFSLIELLTVIAMMALLTTLVAPAFNNLGKSSLLSAEGNRIVNLVNYAGQNSTSRNAMTALVMADPQAGSAYRVFALFECLPEATEWKQVTSWETLKEGIVLDPNTLATLTDSSSQPQPALPSMRYRGGAVGSYKYVIFLPNRSLLQNTSAQLSLAEGTFPSGASSPKFTRPATDGTPANYYRVTVLGATGRPKIDRP